MKCFLCLEKTESTFNIYEGLEEGFVLLDIPNIIEKYVYIKPEITNPMLCNNCWLTVESFYIFCLHIKESHKALCEKTVSPNLYKEEESEISLDVPDNKSDDFYNNESIDNKVILQIDKNEDCTNNIDQIKEDKSINCKLTKRSSTIKSKTGGLRKSKFKSSEEDENEKPPIKKKRLRGSVLRTADAVDEKISKYMTLTCEVCNETLQTLATLKTHYRMVHQKKGYATCCNKKFFKRYLLVDHIDCHLNPEHFKCELCDKLFSVSDCLKKHMKDIHETEKTTYYCDECPKTFIRKSILVRHKAYHSPIESWQFPCEECGKIYPSKFYLTSHKTFSHNRISTKICYICGKDVPTNRYKRHMQMHDSNYEEEKVECEVCKEKFNKRYINIHRQHHKEAEKEGFFCTICNHNSPNRRALYIHMRYTHAEQRKHECQVCHKTFKRKLSLRQHMGTHTGDNLYSCPYCPKTFTYDSNFYIHKKKEHPNEVEIEKQKKKRTNFVQHKEKISKKDNQEQVCETINELAVVSESYEIIKIEEESNIKIEICNSLN